MVNSKSPLVSVCIPVFNGFPFIEQAIDSVLTQTYRNLEIIILDNASTDRTREIVLNFHDKRINYILNPENIGLKNNWNKVLKIARGEFIKLLPADDLIYPNSVENQVQAFLNFSAQNIVLVCSGRDIINQDKKVIITRSFFGIRGMVQGKKAIQKIIRSGTNRLGEPGAILFRKDMLSKTGNFTDEFPYVIDLNLWIRFLQLGNLYSIPESLCAFRVSPQSVSVNTRHSHSHDFSRYAGSLDPNTFDLSGLDIFMGQVNSAILEVLRRFFYKISRLMGLFHGKRKKN